MVLRPLFDVLPSFFLRNDTIPPNRRFLALFMCPLRKTYGSHVRLFRRTNELIYTTSLVYVWVDDVDPNQRVVVYGGYYHRPLGKSFSMY